MNNQENDEILDRAISEVRDETVDAAAVSQAAGRVWARVSAEAAGGAVTSDAGALRTCADFQALMPAWRAGRLSPARAMLVEDHVHQCPACRKPAAKMTPIALVPRRAIAPVWRWAAAAAVVAAAGIGAYMASDRLLVPSGPRATVAALEGTLYQVTGGRNTPVALGASIDELESVRTAMGSGAVIRLRDGSMVEMRQRTELSLSERRSGVTIRLAAGNVIVQAAKQHSRHLFVDAGDCLVSVVGTVFSVNHGIKGSRVAVVQGEVKVAQGDNVSVLHPGDQISTSASLTPVPIEQEIAWSRNVDQYTALLQEFGKLRAKLEAIPSPGLRYSTRLLDLAPAGTVFYAAIPNLGPALAQANGIFHEQLAQSAPLRQWWAEKIGAAGGEAKFDDVLARVEALGSYLGPEVAVMLEPGTTDGKESVLVMAELAKTGFREFLAGEVKDHPEIRIVDDPKTAAAGANAVYVYIAGDLLAVSPDLAQLKRLEAGGGPSPFTQTAFHGQIAQVYKDGVGWLIAADLHTVIGRAKAQHPAAAEDRSGFSDAQYLIVQRKDVSGQTENRAVVTFAQERRGVASWLAAPAPLRALDFVSADATVAAAAVVKDPAALLDDVSALAGGSNSTFLANVANFETATGLSVRDDLAKPLGGEFAFAVDGPMLPMPSWKLVLEVYDPARFQLAIEKVLARVNQAAGGTAAAPQARIDREQSGGRTFYVLRAAKLPVEAHFTYDSGFLIAAPSQELVLRALEYRTTGYTLTRSPKFTALLPHDGQTGFSAMFYSSLGPALSAISGKIPLTPEQQKALQATAGSATPTLVLAYGQPDRIELAGIGNLFGMRLEQLLIQRH
jgi:ferric-dicitrate binding protein FerR (iron transport regulator)